MKHKKNLIAIVLLVFFCRLAISSQSIDKTFEQANQAFDNKDYTLAMQLYDQVIVEKPDNIEAVYWASLAAEASNNHEKRVGYLLKLKALDPSGTKPRELLIQTYQQLGNNPKRDLEHKGLIKLWHQLKNTNPKQSNAYLRDLFRVGSYGVNAFEYFELTGQNARRYIFVPYIGSGDPTFFISLETATQDIASGENLFLLRAYDGKQVFTYQFYAREPTYDQVKDLVFKIITSENPEEISISVDPFMVDLKAWATSDAKKVNASLQKKSNHYLYAHRELTKQFLQNPDNFFIQLNESGVDYLQSIYQKMIGNSDEHFDIRLPVLKHLETDSHKNNIAIIQLPKPSAAAEAYFIAVVNNYSDSNKSHYFTSEKMFGDGEKSMFCEWTSEGHLNYGFGSDNPTNVDHFLERVKNVISNDTSPSIKSNMPSDMNLKK